MQFNEGAHVYSADEQDIGRIEAVVIHPISKKVTHVVIRQGLIFTEDKVIPVDLFETATPDFARLRQDVGELQDLPDFEETHYTPINVTDESVPEVPLTPVGPYYYWYPPAGVSYQHIHGAPVYPATADQPFEPDQPYVEKTTQNIPEGTVALEEGAKVITTDGEHVGDIERVIVEPSADYATHVLITQGWLNRTHRLVPTSWFSRVEEDEIHLAVSSQMIESLPEYTEA